jgi:hypothetical protein
VNDKQLQALPNEDLNLLLYIATAQDGLGRLPTEAEMAAACGLPISVLRIKLARLALMVAPPPPDPIDRDLAAIDREMERVRRQLDGHGEGPMRPWLIASLGTLSLRRWQVEKARYDH